MMDSTKRERPIFWLVSGKQTVVSPADLQQLSSIHGRFTGPIQHLNNGGATLNLASGPLVIMPLMHPMPISSVIDDRLQAAAWPNWKQAASAWRSHAIISTLNNTESPSERRENIIDLLRVSIEFGAKFGADGLGWQGSRLFIPFGMAQRISMQAALPYEFLIRCVNTPAGLTTHGLRMFHLPEVRDMTKGLSLQDASVRLWNFAAYLIESGLITKDGDTIGSDERRSARIRHTSLPDGQLLLELHAC